MDWGRGVSEPVARGRARCAERLFLSARKRGGAAPRATHESPLANSLRRRSGGRGARGDVPAEKGCGFVRLVEPWPRASSSRCVPDRFAQSLRTRSPVRDVSRRRARDSVRGRERDAQRSGVRRFVHWRLCGRERLGRTVVAGGDHGCLCRGGTFAASATEAIDVLGVHRGVVKHRYAALCVRADGQAPEGALLWRGQEGQGAEEGGGSGVGQVQAKNSRAVSGSGGGGGGGNAQL
mmetsp:Transcript_20746/g.67193  ORF Transcript_20746/g.67193 Transcript_20746/m.67193 type:complete len:236 (+) Transcript_20746:353-1060(+)